MECVFPHICRSAGLRSNVCECHRRDHRLRSIWPHQWNRRYLWEVQHVASCGRKRIKTTFNTNRANCFTTATDVSLFMVVVNMLSCAGCVGRRFAHVQETQTQAEWSREVKDQNTQTLQWRSETREMWLLSWIQQFYLSPSRNQVWGNWWHHQVW